MAGLLQQLSGNPLSTPIGQKIDQATDPTLAGEDWALNMEICDMVNDTDEGPRDAVRAIKKRFQQCAGKNHNSVMYTLTVLETCVKNCGKRFHLLVANKDFIQDLVKLIGPKNDPPASLQEKVLSMIQTWADAFRSQPDMQGVYQVYMELKSKGIEFPMTDLDAMAPIHTPQRSVVNAPSIPANQPRPQQQPLNNRVAPRSQPVPTGPVKLNGEQIAKLQSELDIVQSNMQVLNEMLNELTPGKEHTDDWTLLFELHGTCEAMQKRIVELIEKVANEEITIELLRINDEMNTLFVRYERFVKKKSTQTNKSPPSRSNVAQVEISPLIDLGDEINEGTAAPASVSNSDLGTDALVSRINSMAMASKATPSAANFAPGDDFDMFAQSRSNTQEGPKLKTNSYFDNALASEQSSMGLGASSETRAATGVPTNIDSRQDEFDEMERWLQNDVSSSATANVTSVANSDFEQFLADRAMAADNLPNQPKDKKADPFGL